MVEMGEPGALRAFTVCVPWQVLQPGASLSPRAVARPCRLAAYCARSSV